MGRQWRGGIRMVEGSDWKGIQGCRGQSQLLVEDPDPGHVVPDDTGGMTLLGKMSDVTRDGEEG